MPPIPCRALRFALVAASLPLAAAGWPPDEAGTARLVELRAVLGDAASTPAQRDAARAEMLKMILSRPDAPAATMPPRAAVAPEAASAGAVIPATKRPPVPTVSRVAPPAKAAPPMIAPATGAVLAPQGPGYVDPATGRLYQPVAGGYVDPATGLFVAKP